MKKLHFNKKTTIQSSVIAGAIVSIAALSSQAFAWGPERPTLSGSTPADYVTFNSMTDNAKVGDERNFVRIREAGVGDYADEAKLVPGKEYQVMVFYHNNAKDSLNASGEGVAKDTTVKAQMPSVVKPGERGKISGTISASNATPKSVWDEAYVTADTDVALRYVPGSATVTSNGAVNGQVLPDSLFTTGALIGYDNLNGVLPGCTEYSGFVVYKFKVDAPNFEVQKQVSPTGKKQWQDNYVAQPGEKVDYKVSYKNTGTTVQNNVNIKDTSSSALKYQTGSTMLHNATNQNGLSVSDNIVTSGINIGDYAAGGNAVVLYSAKVAEADELACGANTLTNTASIITSGGQKDATATVTVNTECAPNECKPGVPEGDARCACIPAEGQIIDAEGNCVTTPAALPTTGPAETIATLIGVGAMVAGFTYWYRSRQQLKAALAGANFDTTETAEEAPKLLKVRKDHTDTIDKQ